MAELIVIDETTYEATLSEGDKVEIGDKSSKDFKPHIKLNRWDGECFIKCGLQVEAKGQPRVEGNKVKWCCPPNLEAHFYPLEPRIVIAKDKDGKDHQFRQCELGGFEFEAILKKKPKTNKIVLDIETQGLKFYYQPELTPEEIERGCICPDNVVGSYAVYHATRGNMHRSKADAEKYKCGKAFHIYRPKITDAGGNWVWGELSLDEQAGTLITTIPQDFLDSAVYPVSTGTSNFGYETIGSLTVSSSTDYIMGSKGTPASVGTATSITFYLRTGPYDDGPRKLGLYLKSNDTFIEGTAAYSSETPNAWIPHDLESTPSISTVEYAIVHWGEEISIAYDTVTDEAVYKTEAYPGTWPSPITWTDADFDQKSSIYCTYTPEAPPTFIPTVTIIG